VDVSSDAQNPPEAVISSRASVATERAARYGKQLSTHLAHKRKTTWQADAQTGDVTFEHGRATLTATSSRLDLAIELDPTIEGADAVAELAHIEDVVGRHLARFGGRDELIVSWVRSDGTAGQSYGRASEEQST
jgi:uncharacterized protein